MSGRTPYPEGWASLQLCGAESSDLLKSTFLYETFQFFSIESKIFKNAKNTVWVARLIYLWSTSNHDFSNKSEEAQKVEVI